MLAKNTYNLWPVNGYQQDFRTVANFGFGGSIGMGLRPRVAEAFHESRSLLAKALAEAQNATSHMQTVRQNLKMTTVPTNNLIKMLHDMSKLIILVATPFLLTSCTQTNQETDLKQQSDYPLPTYFSTYTDTLLELTPEQQSAFDALNTLQVSTDEKDQFYSTFAGFTQPCYPPDTSLTISRSKLLTAMEQFVTRHCTNLTMKERSELIATAVLAQEEYMVLHCTDKSSNFDYENGLPMTGTWVIPSVLGRRDVIIVW